MDAQTAKLIARIAENLPDLSREEIQRLSEDLRDLKKTVGDALLAFKSAKGKFADEEVESSHGYPPDYKPKGIDEQIECLRELLPDIGEADESIASKPLPDGAEAWFAIPRRKRVADTYEEAVQKVLDQIKQTRDGEFYNRREGRLGSQYLRQHERTVAMLKKLGDQQSGYNILVVPAQFGFRHRERSVRRAREVFTDDEFGLGALHVACMFLTHPKRLQHYDDLWFDCPGDEHAPGADRIFSGTPYFKFRDGKVEFDTHWVNGPYGYCGSVSGFVSQS